MVSAVNQVYSHRNVPVAHPEAYEDSAPLPPHQIFSGFTWCTIRSRSRKLRQIDLPPDLRMPNVRSVFALADASPIDHMGGSPVSRIVAFPLEEGRCSCVDETL